MYCRKCGAALSDGDRFCPKCGAGQAKEIQFLWETPEERAERPAYRSTYNGIAIAGFVTALASWVIDL